MSPKTRGALIGFLLTVNQIDVGIHAVKAVRSLITSTDGAEVPRQARTRLLDDLRSAERAFAEHRKEEGREMLDQYVKHLKEFSARKEINEDVAKRLIGQADEIVTCVLDQLKRHGDSVEEEAEEGE